MSPVLRAFTRSRVLMGPVKKDAQVAMSKWWGKQRPAEGEITQTITAYEQLPVGPWLKTFPKKTFDRAPSYIIWLGGVAVIYFGSIESANREYEDEVYSHRP